MSNMNSGMGMNSNMQAMSGSMSGDIVDKAMADPDLSTLVSLIQKAGLVDTLKDTTKQYTVFAPTNAAFAKIPADKLAALGNDPAKLKMVLLYHVLPMSVPSSSAKTMSAMTAEGTEAKIKVKTMTGMAPMVMVNKAKVTQADIMASNGVIHKIDTVLMPKMGNMKMSGNMNSNMGSMNSNMNSNMSKKKNKNKNMSNGNMSNMNMSNGNMSNSNTPR
jgi:uncharacterized surface protein with fasciclin (FAS1) repeats